MSEAMSTEAQYAGENGDQFATFYVGSFLFGIDVMKVQEIIRYLETTPVPLSSSEVEGLINLRGQIITAIDLRRRIGMEDRPEGQSPMNVVVRTEDGTLSLLVDRIGDVLEVGDAQFEETPNTVHGVTRSLMEGVYKLDGRLLLVLDLEKAVDAGFSE